MLIPCYEFCFLFYMIFFGVEVSFVRLIEEVSFTESLSLRRGHEIEIMLSGSYACMTRHREVIHACCQVLLLHGSIRGILSRGRTDGQNADGSLNIRNFPMYRFIERDKVGMDTCFHQVCLHEANERQHKPYLMIEVGRRLGLCELCGDSPRTYVLTLRFTCILRLIAT